MKLSFKEKYSYGLGALGKDLAYGIVGTYLMFYFTDVIGLAPAFVGTLFLVARVWDAFNDPAMGMIVDNTRSKWGKFRPWIFIGTIINAVVIVFLFFKPNLSPTGLMAYYAIMYILWGMTYTIMDIPYWSMIPSLAQDKEEREKISVIPRIFASLGGLLVATFGLSIVAKLGNGDQVKGFFGFGILIAVAFVITITITCINVKDSSATTVNTKKAKKVTLKESFKIIKSNDQLVVFIGIVLAFNLAMQLAGGMAIYYFKYVIGNESLFPVFTAFAGIAEMSALVLFPMLTRKIGRPTVFKIAAILPVIGLFMLLGAGFVAPESAIFVAVSGIILKLGSGLTLGSSTVMLADIVDYGEVKLGSRNESIVFSCQTLLVKSASAVSAWLVGVGLTVVGYVANAEQTAQTILGMRVLMVVIPAVVSILSYIVYKKFYKINGKYHDEMLEELEAKRANDLETVM